MPSARAHVGRAIGTCDQQPLTQVMVLPQVQGSPGQPYLVDGLQAGAYFIKHERNKRTRKWVVLSPDLQSLMWRTVSVDEYVTPGDASCTSNKSSTATPRSIVRSPSFSKSQSISLADVSHIIYGPFTEAFAKKSAQTRQDERAVCFSLIMRDNKTIDLAAEDDSQVLVWLFGLQQLVTWLSSAPQTLQRWTMPKLRLQKIRLAVAGESEKTGQGLYNVVLAAVIKAVDEREDDTERTIKLQSAWRKRNAHFKFQTKIQEMLELDCLIEGLGTRERELKAAANETASKIEHALMLSSVEQAPPPMPSDAEMRNSKKMEQYMLQMGEYAAWQQIRLQDLQDEVRENQKLSAEAAKYSCDRRQLQAMNDRLRLSMNNPQLAALTHAERKRVADIQRQLGITPHGFIRVASVREARLYKATPQSRLGIIFYQALPEMLDEKSADRVMSEASSLGVVLPIVKTIDPAGAAAKCLDLHEGDEVISINGIAAFSNVVAVKMLRDAQGEVVLAVRTTPLSKRPSLVASPRASKSATSRATAEPHRLTGMRPLSAANTNF